MLIRSGLITASWVTTVRVWSQAHACSAHASRAGRARERIERRRLYVRCRVDGGPLRDDVSLGLTGPASVVAMIDPHVELVLGLAALGDDRRRVYRTQ
jgi:hypothetical protein